MSLCSCGGRLAPVGMEAPAGITMCASCAPAAVLPVEAAGNQNVAAGAAVGFIAAVAVATVWFAVVSATQYQIPLIALAVGWIIGQAVVMGGRTRGGKLQGIAVGLTLLSMVASEYLIAIHFHNIWAAAEGLGPASWIRPVTDMIAIVGESLAADPFTLLFWLLALAMAFRVAGLPRPKEAR